MKNEPIELMPGNGLGRVMLLARELIDVACDYVAERGDRCLADADTPAFIRSIYSDQGLHTVQKAG